jgi:fumarate hydratase class II
MNIAAIGQLNLHLHPPLKHLQEVFKKKSKDFSSMS